jgi:hypothetical protein
VGPREEGHRLHFDVRVGTGLVGGERLAALKAEVAALLALGVVRRVWSGCRTPPIRASRSHCVTSDQRQNRVLTRGLRTSPDVGGSTSTVDLRTHEAEQSRADQVVTSRV